MAHSLSAKKRVRQAEKRRARNRARKELVKDQVKSFSAAIVAGIPLEHWVVYLTVALLLVQLGYSLWKWARELRRAKTGA